MKKILFYLLPLLLMAGCQKEEIREEPYIPFGEQVKSALLELYDATDGPNWTKQPNWAEAIYPHFDFVDFDWNLVIDLSDMELSGELPTSLFDLPITSIDLSGNHLHGTLPENVGKNGLLHQLYINDNDFTGSLPASLANSVKVHVDCRNNKMGGELPQEIVSDCLQLQNWGLSPQQENFRFEPLAVANFQEKDVAALRAIYNEANDEAKEALGWNLNGDPSTWKGVSWNAMGQCIGLEMNRKNLKNLSSHIADLTALKLLDLRNNQLTEFPPISELTHLQWLNLSDNGIVSLPENLSLSTELRCLDLYANNITGNIPAEINRLKNLVMLDLSENRFTGTYPVMDQLTELRCLMLGDQPEMDIQPLPEWLSKLKKLQICFLYENNLAGTIPECLSELTDLVYFDVESNHLNGSVEKLFSKMKLLSSVALDDNTFTGPLPEFNEENHLDYLSMDSNNFSGEIPDHWRRLKNTSTIEFEDNLITGNIPAYIGDFKNICYIYCERNMMSGILPVKVTRLKYFFQFRWEEQYGPGLKLPETVRSASRPMASYPASAQKKADRYQEMKAGFAGELRQSLGL